MLEISFIIISSVSDIFGHLYTQLTHTTLPLYRYVASTVPYISIHRRYQHQHLREEEKFVPYFLHHNPDIAFRILFSIQCLDMNFDTGIREGSRQEKFAI